MDWIYFEGSKGPLRPSDLNYNTTFLLFKNVGRNALTTAEEAKLWKSRNTQQQQSTPSPLV